MLYKTRLHGPWRLGSSQGGPHGQRAHPSEREPSETATRRLSSNMVGNRANVLDDYDQLSKRIIRKYSGDPMRSNLKTHETGLFLQRCNLTQLVSWSLPGCFLHVSSEPGSNMGFSCPPKIRLMLHIKVICVLLVFNPIPAHQPGTPPTALPLHPSSILSRPLPLAAS